jgi:hypothetical protein
MATGSLAAWWNDKKQTQQEVDARRREDLLYHFQAATAK